MRCILCKNKTVEERLTATNRMITFMLVIMGLMAAVVLYDIIMAVLNDTEMFRHLGQESTTICLLVCTLCLNIRNKKEYEAELANNNDEA